MELTELYKEVLKFLEVGDKIYFTGEKKGYEIKARNKRYLICVKNIFGSPYYTILDSEKLINSTNNYVFNPYDYFNQDDINQSLKDLQNDKYELSSRHQANSLDVIDRFKKKGDKRVVAFTDPGAQVLCISDAIVEKTMDEAYKEFHEKVGKN